MHLTNHSHFGAALQQPRRQSGSSPSLLAAWRDLWRSLPYDIRRDTIALFCLTPTLLEAFAFAWVMLP
ncbi:hypothetical protein [Novosphingobium guangzhouense]|uniref:Uncharacterized protein n=1 Tax=Novosphingobium guangzhouense TaxID=1850347 RepID=A0A2K2FZT8_9SPHN|nr:hypothetical protein [Novosphingobium guangzhouense]PNU04293.1 hypothetical protein A8V01_21225 [Novosphingobium guangzhouense]